MPSLTTNYTASFLGIGANKSVTSADAVGVVATPTIPAAKSGALTTRSSDTAGTLTMEADHGITTAARLDLYWSGGRRLGITVGTVSGTSVPISSGAGDVLPADETAVTAMVPVSEPFAILDTDDVVGLFLSANTNASAVLIDSLSATLATISCTGSQGSYIWQSGNGVTNPLDGGTDNTATVYLSHDSTSAQVVNMVAVVE